MHKCITDGCGNTLSHNQHMDHELCKVCMKDDNMVPDTANRMVRLNTRRAIRFSWQVAVVMLRVYLRYGKVSDAWAPALEITLMKHFDWMMGYMLTTPLSALDVEKYRIQDLSRFFWRGPVSKRPKWLYEKRTTRWKKTVNSRCIHCGCFPKDCLCSDGSNDSDEWIICNH